MNLNTDEIDDYEMGHKSLDELKKIIEEDKQNLQKMSEYHKDMMDEKDKIYQIAKKYGFEKNFDNIYFIFNVFESLVNLLLTQYFISNKLQLAELVSMLQSCRGSDIVVSGIVTNPKEGEVKTQVKKVTLSSEQDIFYLNLWANKMLNTHQDGQYEYEFNWDFKPKLRRYDKYRIEFEDEFYIEPYTDEEIKKIIEYEKKEKGTYSLTWNAEIGRCLAFFYDLLSKKRVFNAMNEKKEKGKAKGITKEYCFMYDCLVFLQAAEMLEDNKEKYTKVKDWIKTFFYQSSK